MFQTGRACYLEAIEGLCISLRARLATLNEGDQEQVREIRLTVGTPPLVNVGGKRVRLEGPVTAQELSNSIITLCGCSMHSHQRELAQGYLSIPGGHRIGIAGTAVYGDSQTVQSIRDVSALVIRVAHDCGGGALPLLSRLFVGGVCGAILAGAPGSGKTTLLRDLARCLAEGKVPECSSVVLVDERGELGRGVAECCVLRGYDKGEGILSAVRSLAPQVVLCDEIGSRSDVEAVRWALNCGVAVITTIHAKSVDELCRREAGRALLETGAFERVAFLSAYPCPGTIREVVRIDELDTDCRNLSTGNQLHTVRCLEGRTLSTACV